MKRRLLLTLSLCLISVLLSLVTAYSGELEIVDHKTEQEGLFSNAVTAVSPADEAGVFIASAGGLHILIDDFFLPIFQNIPGRALAGGPGGTLWAAADDSLVYRIIERDAIWSATRIPVDPGKKITAIAAGREGVTVGTDSGLYYYGDEDPTFRTIIGTGAFTTLAADADGVVIAGCRDETHTSGGVLIIGGSFGSRTGWVEELSGSNVTALLVDDERLLIGTQSGGLFVLDDAGVHSLPLGPDAGGVTALLVDRRDHAGRDRPGLFLREVRRDVRAPFGVRRRYTCRRHLPRSRTEGQNMGRDPGKRDLSCAGTPLELFVIGICLMYEQSVTRDTRAVIDLSAVADSIRGIRGLVGDAVEVMAVVKADGYGHGALRVARTALANGATRLGVAYVQEAVELREAGVSAPLLILGIAPPEAVRPVLEYDLAQSVCETETPRALSAKASADRPARLHVKVDTGMGRIGVIPEDTPDYVAFLQKLPHVIIEGIFTHFPKSDETDPAFTNRQIETFTGLLRELSSRGIEIPLRHMANSGGVLAFRASYLNLVRPGIMIYGLYPSREVARTIPLRPAMALVTKIRFLKRVPPGTPISYGGTYVTKSETAVATLPVGYADGYRRLLSNRYDVLVRGVRAPVIGRVCMDMTMIDVTHVSGARVGDDVVLMGRQGDQEISIDDMADSLSTINYEITCLVGKRVPRVYVNE